MFCFYKDEFEEYCLKQNIKSGEALYFVQLLNGNSIEEIAKSFNVTIRGVRKALQTIYENVGVANRELLVVHFFNYYVLRKKVAKRHKDAIDIMNIADRQWIGINLKLSKSLIPKRSKG